LLTIAQTIVVEELANEVISRIATAIRTVPLNRVSVRFENGEEKRTSFTATANASGRLINSLRFEIVNDELIVYGNDYIYYLIYGRKQTKNGGSGVVKSDIRNWIDAKGITPDDGMSKDTLAFLITRKIHRMGNSIYLASGGQNSGLLTNVLNENIIKKFNSKFTVTVADDFKEI